jgi:4-hydroxy-tetrahydrodipicolinate reductase
MMKHHLVLVRAVLLLILRGPKQQWLYLISQLAVKQQWLLAQLAYRMRRRQSLQKRHSIRQVARQLSDGWDIEIVEAHHNQKVDAPSGTALALGHAAADGRGVALDNVRDSGRDGITGIRKEGDIGFAVLRGGDVAGEHSVVFYGEQESLSLTHKANSRTVFARGALRAARFAAAQAAPGLFTMDDVLEG